MDKKSFEFLKIRSITFTKNLSTDQGDIMAWHAKCDIQGDDEFYRLSAKSTKYLFFDTETTGLPKNKTFMQKDVQIWPRLVQIAWLVCEDDGGIIDRRSAIVKPCGFIIPESASNIHAITTERANIEGLPLRSVLLDFSKAASMSNIAVAHNLSFDESVIAAEYNRQQLDYPLNGLGKICTMKSSANFCKIPGYKGYKWPSLTELHTTLFSSAYKGAHNAETDVLACARCFFELKQRGVLKGTWLY